MTLTKIEQKLLEQKIADKSGKRDAEILNLRDAKDFLHYGTLEEIFEAIAPDITETIISLCERTRCKKMEE